VSVGVGAGRATRGGQEPLVQHLGRDLAGVADLAQPGTQAGRGEPVDLGLGGEPLQEREADLGVQVAEQPHDARQHDVQVRAQLVGGGDTMLDQVAAGPHAAAQCKRRGRGPGQRCEATPVGTDHVGQHVGVVPVVLVPGRPVARAEVLHLVRRDHQRAQSGG
jgi:hypothetical protein